jgi:nucleoside-diphosphate-sugar epimerase
VDEKRVGVIGATSLVGEYLLSQLADSGWRIIAFSRQQLEPVEGRVEWRQLMTSLPAPVDPGKDSIEYWIFLAPIWILPKYFDFLKLHGACRIIALSSTSRFSKYNSSDKKEQAVAQSLEDGEARLQLWADENRVEWVVLRPTMIYGRGKDKNISAIARFINRFGFFPLLGRAEGKRQPVHAADVAQACVAALDQSAARGQAYNLSGGEILSYYNMVIRVFSGLGRKPRLMVLPLGIFRMAITCMRCLPQCRNWSIAMAERMQRDLIFDHNDAMHDLNFAPRPFHLTKEDLPINRM